MLIITQNTCSISGKLRDGDLAILKTLCYHQHMLNTKKKQSIIKKNQIHVKDTGSPEVQVAILSTQIEELAKHLKKHKKDNHSRRGLLKVIAKRRRILNYLQKLDEKRYKKLIKDLGLKK